MEEMSLSNTVLAKEIIRGDTRAFKEFYDRRHTQCYYLARKYLKDPSLAKDAVQEVFLKLWNKRQTLDPSSSVEGLLFTMLKHHLLNMIRDEDNRKKVIREVKRITKDRKPVNHTEKEILYTEYESLFQKAMVKLSPAEREVFELRSSDGLSNAEVAEIRGVSEHTVKTQYYLGSKFIRNYLKKHGGILLFLLVVLIR
jgi:RNA polymerase sigma-70 factor (ECF subfamily)